MRRRTSNIEIESEGERNEKLAAWLELPKHLYAKLEDGTKVRPTYDARQVGDAHVDNQRGFRAHQCLPIRLGAIARMAGEESDAARNVAVGYR